MDAKSVLIKLPIKLPILVISSIVACADESSLPLVGPADVVISEIVSTNAGGGRGAARDEHGEYDDWIELENRSDRTLDLSGLWVSDSVDDPWRSRVPEDSAITIEPRGRVLLWMDGEMHQGPAHLPLSLGAKGEALLIHSSGGELIDRADFPPIGRGRSWARTQDGSSFELCANPTPAAKNDCVAPILPKRREYAPYVWPEVWPESIASPVVMSEVDPFGVAEGTAWVELANVSADPVDLDSLTLRVATVVPPATLPSPIPPGGLGAPREVSMSGMLLPGGRRVIPLARLDPKSGVLVLGGPGGLLYDRVAIESAQPGTILQLPSDGRGLRLSCDASSTTPGAANGPCLPPLLRAEPPPFLRFIGSDADYLALAHAGEEVQADALSLKFIIDRAADNEVYFIDSARWPLHFDWVWEVIEGHAPFELCDPADRTRHAEEWGRFSQVNYFNVESRDYLLGTLILYQASGLMTVEFASGDRITPEMMREVYFEVARRVHVGKQAAIRPTTARFEGAVLQIEGRVPLAPIDRPFEGQVLQSLNPAVGYGVLEFFEGSDLESSGLSYQSIPILERIPNDIPTVGGMITEEFQTPLAHVNVLARNRGTPNLALLDARHDPRVLPFLGKLVRFEVKRTGFDLRAASVAEAEAFWAARREARGTFVPELDPSRREIVNLATQSLADIPTIGAKAAQYAELANMSWSRWAGGVTSACALTPIAPQLPVPRPAFAVPFSRYVEHLARSGVDLEIERSLNDPDFRANPLIRRQRLSAIRDRIQNATVDPELVLELTKLLGSHFGNDRVRFRSSTNVEDLPGFNGAGLYSSKAAQVGNPRRAIEDALREVWASVWSFRGFEERELFGVDQRAVAMGVLIHRGFPGEEANGVAITRNIVNPTSHGFYINAQVGELEVANPDGDELPEQVVYQLFSPPEVVLLARSTATGGAPILTNPELHRLSCALRAAHNRFRDLYAPKISGERFALDVEFKIDGPQRELFFKQARPFVEQGGVETTTACQ